PHRDSEPFKASVWRPLVLTTVTASLLGPSYRRPRYSTLPSARPLPASMNRSPPRRCWALSVLQTTSFPGDSRPARTNSWKLTRPLSVRRGTAATAGGSGSAGRGDGEPLPEG